MGVTGVQTCALPICSDRLGCPVNADRALVQEAAIGRTATDAPVLGSTGPITVFNGAETERFWRSADTRVVISRAALAPPVGCPATRAQPVAGAVDSHDVLADHDLPLTTAALLSARFPLLEPSARLGTRDAADGDGCAPDRREASVRRVADGGLYENTGLATILQLLPAIRRAVDAWRDADGS